MFHERRRELHRARLELLAAAAADIIADAQARERKLISAARRIINQLAPITGELNQLLAAVREVIVAQDAMDATAVGSARAMAMRAAIDLSDLLEAVQHGASLLGPEPISADGMIEVVNAASAPEPSVRARVDPSLSRGVSL